MRKISKNIAACFLTDTKVNEGNSSVSIEYDGSVGSVTYMKLHGNNIARKLTGNKNMFEICNGGWFSNTTKERLNGLQNVSIQQKKGVWYLNGEVWNGGWTLINL